MPEIQTVVAQYQERIQRHSLRYKHLVQCARDEGDTFCARRASYWQGHLTHPPSSPPPSPPSEERRQSVPVIACRKEDGERHPKKFLYVAPSSGQSGHEQLTSSVATSGVHATTDHHNPRFSEYPWYPEERKRVMLTEMVKPPSLHYGDSRSSHNSPGWVYQERFLCYQCYAVDGHIVPNCSIALKRMPKSVGSYKALSTADHERVPRTAQNPGKLFLQGWGETNYREQVTQGSGNLNRLEKLVLVLGWEINNILRRRTDDNKPSFSVSKIPSERVANFALQYLHLYKTFSPLLRILQQPFKTHIDRAVPKAIFLMTIQNCRVYACIGRSLSNITYLPGILHTEAGSRSIWKDILPEELKQSSNHTLCSPPCVLENRLIM